MVERPDKKITILIPAFNEEKTIDLILERVLEQTQNWDREIIVINDGSTDKTLEKIQPFSNEISIISYEKNQGKGVALKMGLEKATGDIVVIQDADLEYNPEDYPKLLEPILKEKTEIVYGSRNLNLENKPSSKIYKFGGQLITSFFNLLFKTNLTDINTGYKIFKKGVFDKIKLQEKGFGFCEEFTAQAVRSGYNIVELPISYFPRNFNQGKKITWRHGLRAILVIFKNRFAKNY